MNPDLHSHAFEAVKSSPADIIDAARNGQMFILLDDEDRENEGDLVIPAQMATPQAIAFMATQGRGLICLALTGAQVETLGLPLMAQRNESRLSTAFTVSIEARTGVSTGISAPDRAHTIAVAINPQSGADDLATPGHVFPLLARDGGCLERAGHTEAGVDIARLAGLNPSAVICEIMRDDGTMARRDDLVAFAQRHDLKLGTIADLIAYRMAHDRFLTAEDDSEIETAEGRFRLLTYRNRLDGSLHYALVKGQVRGDRPCLTRVHAVSPLADLIGVQGSGRQGLIQTALQRIAAEEQGVLVLITAPHAMPAAFTALNASGQGERLLTYGVGAQILRDLGVTRMRLLSTQPQQVPVGLAGYGLSLVEQIPLATA